MLAFDLLLRSDGGDCRTVRVSAIDAHEARRHPDIVGAQILACEPTRARSTKESVERALPAAQVETLAQDFAALLQAGLTIVQALQTLESGSRPGALRAALRATSRDVVEGLPLSQALQRRGTQFPALMTASVRASEQTGDLAEALRRYAEHQQRLRGLREKVVGAAVYPTLLLALGSVVVLFLLGFVVPKFATLIESTRQELPWSSRMLMAWGGFVARHGYTVAMAAGGLLIAAVLAWRHWKASSTRAAWTEALPVVGPLIREFRHAQLFRTVGMLVKGGIPLPQAMGMGVTLLSRDDEVRLMKAIAWLREGRSLNDAMQSLGLADPVSSSMIAVAERTGTLADILDRIGEFKEERLRRSVDWASRLIEPLLMVAIGLVIGTIVVMMYLPIFDLASSLQ